MKHRLFLIALGTLTLLSFSIPAFASGEEEAKVNQLSSPQLGESEEDQEQQRCNDHHSIVRWFAHGDSSSTERVSLKSKVFTEEEFLQYFGEDGIYKKAQCLDLTYSSFHPEWLRYLPNTIKALKLERINTKVFSQYGFSDESTMKIEIARVLAEALTNLKFLNISYNEIGPKGASYIAQLNALTFLNIERNAIGDEGVLHLAKLTNLTSLDISGNKISDAGARHIAENLTALTDLSIRDNKKIGDVGAEHIAQMTTLTSLNICCTRIGDKGIRYIAENLQSLKDLAISATPIGIEGIRHIAKNLGALEHLGAAGIRLGDEGAKIIAENLRSLESLYITGCDIEAEGARLIAENLIHLKYMGIFHNAIGDEGVLHLAKLTNLTSLEAPSDGVREEVKQELRERLPSCFIQFY